MSSAADAGLADAARRFWRSSSVRLTLIAWLSVWLINALLIVAFYDFTVAALTRDITADIERDIDQRLEAWPRQLPAHAGVTSWLYRQFAMEMADLEGCVALYETDGELLLANFDTSAEESLVVDRYFTVRFGGQRFQSEPGASFERCLVREHHLPDGGRLIYGKPFDSYYDTIVQLRRLRLWGLLLTGTISLLLSLVLARRALSGISLLARACDRVALGDLRQRVPITGRDSDLDHIAVAFNRMLDQIEQLMGGVREVSDAIAHDLKTPLARLRGQLELLLNLPERSDEAIEAVIAEADQVLAAFNALLRIAQLEQGTRRQAFVDFRIGALLEQLGELFELMFAEKQIDFRLVPPAADFSLYGDRDLWLQALINLLDNAYKYTPAGGHVSLEARRVGDHAELQLRDSGPGIPEGDRDNVFKRFFRLEKHRTTRGTGLGLALVAAVCKAHQASIRLANDNGLVITIEVPLAVQTDPAAAKQVPRA